MSKIQQPFDQVLAAWAREAFEKAYGENEIDLSGVGIVATGNPDFGDYQCNAAMSLAKILKKAPRTVAEQAMAAVPVPPIVPPLLTVKRSVPAATLSDPVVPLISSVP